MPNDGATCGAVGTLKKEHKIQANLESSGFMYCTSREPGVARENMATLNLWAPLLSPCGHPLTHLVDYTAPAG